MARHPLLQFPVKPAGTTFAWILWSDQLDRWTSQFPDLDVLRECRAALAWVEAAPPARRKTARGMSRFLVNWFLRARRDARVRPSRGQAPASVIWTCPHAVRCHTRQRCLATTLATAEGISYYAAFARLEKAGWR